MGASSIINDMIEEKLMGLNTAFIAKVISVSNPTSCTIQPLDKIKAYGQKAKTQAVVTGVPILNHVRHYTLVKQSLTITDTYTGGGSVAPNPHPAENNIGHIKVEPIRPGDIVLCMCAQRDISGSVKGASIVPPVGHHQIKDAIVVGLLGGWNHE